MHSTLILSFLILAAQVSFTTAVSFPIQSQLPLIARVGTPYTWSISPNTFANSSTLAAADLPSWLSFSNYTFSGTPTADDEGNVDITVSAGADSDGFSLCVTSFPPPVLSIPLSAQFNSSNPSFSSVFLLHPNSALASTPPALRVPPNWSFSVGFEGGTFVAASSNAVSKRGGSGSGSLFYAALQADGTPLPSWLTFNPHTVTFNGVTRSPPTFDPDRVSVVLIASDQEGYSALNAPFDIVVASHELSFEGTQPILPINATIGEAFNFTVRGNDWLLEDVLYDNRSIRTTDLTSMSIDTSGHTWLDYDASSFSLSGIAPTSSSGSVSFTLPVSISAANQTLSLNTSLVLLPSYFNEDTAKPTFAPPGTVVTLPLSSYISHDSSFQGHNVSLNATYDPSAASAFLQVAQGTSGDASDWAVSGMIPSDVNYAHINVTFTAFDQTTHATSQLAALIEIHGASYFDPASAFARKRKVALGVGLSFGAVGGVVALFGFLACCRKCCAVPDSAQDPYANEKAYVIEPDMNGYGWTEKLGLGLGLGGKVERQSKTGMAGVRFDTVQSPSIHTLPVLPTTLGDQAYHSPYNGVGLGAAPLPGRTVKKGAFFEGVKTAIRKVSGSLSRKKSAQVTISRPILMFTRGSDDSIGSVNHPGGPRAPLTNFSNAANSNIALAGSFKSADVMDSDVLSLGMNSSPSSSTRHTGKSGGSEKSVPRRRPDFGPPRATLGLTPPLPSNAAQRWSPGQQRGHPSNQHVRRRSTDSQHSQFSGEIEEAVIATASRAPSVRSAHSSYSYAPSAHENAAKPRLVQFTSARGVPVPVPSLPSAYTHNGRIEVDGVRRVSHIAHVYGAGDAAATAEGDDAILNEGMRYVRAFGNQNDDLEPTHPPNLSSPSPSTFTSPALSARSRSRPASASTKHSASPVLTTSTHSRSLIPTQTSYMYPSPSASFDSNLDGGGAATMSRILIGTGEAFAFKYPVSVPALPSPGSGSSSKARARARVLIAALLHGEGKLPAFLSYAYAPGGRSGKEEVEFWGTPGVGDVGEIMIGVYDEQGECVGRLVVEVVGRG